VSGLNRVMLTGDAVGGVWRYSLELARGFAREGVETVLAVLGPPPGSQQQAEADAIPGLWIVPTGLPLDWTAADEDALRAAGAALAGLAQRVRADTVQLHAPALAAEVAWAQPLVAVVHSDVGTWWDAVHPGESLPDDLAWRAAAVGRGLAEAHVVLAPTRSFARLLARRYRPGRSIEVVPNGRTLPSVAALPRVPAVLAAGRLWDEGKNIAVLDRAAAALDVPVSAAGPLRGPVGGAAVLSNIRHLGVLDQATLAAEMAQATVFAAPSRYEPFGLAVLEAAQAGMALALADIPTFRELWEGAALFFHPEDAGRLADTIGRLLAAPAGHAARARERAARFTAEAMTARTLAHHRALIDGRSSLCA
jgi:glycosyltransferase involved in cell wall biosynthesis